jgi:Flp pilus assembly CpaF family ATPase
VKVWLNKINDSRRTLIEVPGIEATLGRDPANQIVLESPLVSRRHAVVRRAGEQYTLENLGLNSCQVGDINVPSGESLSFEAGAVVRIWPYSLTFESETIRQVSRDEIEKHLRSILCDLELRIHRKLLERLDLFDMQGSRQADRESILLLENNIQDICRELNVFGPENEPLLDELVGLIFRDLLVNQIIMESSQYDGATPSLLAPNEFDIPATLIPEREAELRHVLDFMLQRIEFHHASDVTTRVRQIEARAADVFPVVRPHLHRELRSYAILRAIKKDLKDIVFGFGPLQDLLRAPTITEIMVVASDQIYVERDGVIERSGRRFISDQVTESVIERIVAQVGRRIDKSQPLVDARLPDGSRVNAIIPPLAISGPCLTVRRFPAKRLSVDDLIHFGSLTTAAAAFLGAAVQNHRNLLIGGGTGAGKTTLLNALSSFIPPKERIVTIEDTSELRLHQEHVVTLETKMANVEGQGAYTTRDLVRNALRMRPDRLIVGECRGPEVLDMLQAMNTGHDGSMTTLHANSSAEVIERLELLVLTAAELPLKAIHRQIASALDLIVQIKRLPSGRRVVSQISEVVRVDEETGNVVIADIFNFRDGRSLQPTGFLPTFMDELVGQGFLELRALYGEGEVGDSTSPMPLSNASWPADGGPSRTRA